MLCHSKSVSQSCHGSPLDQVEVWDLDSMDKAYSVGFRPKYDIIRAFKLERFLEMRQLAMASHCQGSDLRKEQGVKGLYRDRQKS